MSNQDILQAFLDLNNDYFLIFIFRIFGVQKALRILLESNDFDRSKAVELIELLQQLQKIENQIYERHL